jgi:N6-adenosine-specific RNA methylase IME4
MADRGLQSQTNGKMKYQIIYSDPAWTYEDKALAGNRGAGCKYDLMTIPEMKNLPVKDMADKDCVLFMWVTMPKLNECFELINSWGFEYKTVAFTWVKTNRNNGQPFMGMGRWTRANAELCLLATKGKPKRINAGVQQIVLSKIREHSQKPDEVYTRIEELMGDLPRIELFSRHKREGWDVWGNQVPNWQQNKITITNKWKKQI